MAGHEACAALVVGDHGQRLAPAFGPQGRGYRATTVLDVADRSGPQGRPGRAVVEVERSAARDVVRPADVVRRAVGFGAAGGGVLALSATATYLGLLLGGARFAPLLLVALVLGTPAAGAVAGAATGVAVARWAGRGAVLAALGTAAVVGAALGAAVAAGTGDGLRWFDLAVGAAATVTVARLALGPRAD
ncbi:hypothetical protein FTX61_00080 [Nitriliruptoraceae bacterium ZYF776]|nr:hypothetical protein [Profundirhabdus halotolerans]